MEERISAREGSYKSEELLGAESMSVLTYAWIVPPPVLVKLSELGLLGEDLLASGSQIWADKNMEYSGKGLNNLECYWVKNPIKELITTEEQQYVNANFLYNQEFSKENKVKFGQGEHVLTDSIISFDEFAVAKEAALNYSLDSRSSGIADINYGKIFKGPIHFKTKPVIENEGHERYVGEYSISKNIQMTSFYSKNITADNWIPCCAGGWNTMPQLYQAAVGKDDKGVFDCTCYKAPTIAQFPRVY